MSIFDEKYYLDKYPDIKKAVNDGIIINAHHHYIYCGILESRYPNRNFELECSIEKNKSNIDDTKFDECFYQYNYEIANVFVKTYTLYSLYDFYLKYGWKMGHLKNSDDKKKNKYDICRNNPSYKVDDKIIDNFDVNYYIERYKDIGLYPLSHYKKEGAKNGNSINKWFDELFYRSFYDDINNAIKYGSLTSGIQHYLDHGLNEGRLVKHDLISCLNSKHKQVIQPCGIEMTLSIEYSLQPIKYKIQPSQDRTIWILIKSLNPDFYFGGYHSYIQFIDRLILNNYKIGIVFTPNGFGNIDYFMYHYPNSLITKNINNIKIISLDDELLISNKDIFIVNNFWDALKVKELIKITNTKLIFYVVEYEPTLYKRDSTHFLASEVYDSEYYPIFNSECLKNYFETNKIGLFSKERSLTVLSSSKPLIQNSQNSQSTSDYFVYEHVILSIPQQKIKHHLYNKNYKRLIFYARPEKYAIRNLFEIGIIALKRAISRGHFKGWFIEGIGCTSGNYIIDLGSDVKMKIHTKMKTEEYKDFLLNSDVGLSLIYTPHPGLVHFEMVNAGLVTVVNTFQNRPKEFFEKCERFVPVDPKIDDIVDGLIKAEALSYDLDLRLKPSPFENNNTWDDIFSGDNINNIINSVSVN